MRSDTQNLLYLMQNLLSFLTKQVLMVALVLKEIWNFLNSIIVYNFRILVHLTATCDLAK
jgi:hypothetical protein